ncbi:unnamed protein product [Trichobilharzia regenti]|nr:unnamed protein product [Trichobilharzia regenti]
MNRGGPGGLDMNVRSVWARGYTGQGVVVTILDDGLETDHPDLKDNYFFEMKAKSVCIEEYHSPKQLYL